MGQKDLRGKLLEDYEDVFSDKPWNDTKTLHSIMNIPEEFKSFVQDYKVMVFDIAFLEDEIIERFTSDFKLVAKFFKNKRLGNRNLFDNDKINHMQELMDFLAVFTNDDRYKEIKPKLVKIEKEGGPVRMCNVAQALEEKGIEKGIRQERINRIQSMICKGKLKEEILEWDYTEEEYFEAEKQLLIMV